MDITFSNYDAPGNPWYDGGGAAAIHELGRRLVGKGHSVRVLAGRFPGCRGGAFDGVTYEFAGPLWAGPRLGQVLFQCLLPGKVRQGGFSHWIESLFPPLSTACLQWHTSEPVVALTQVLAGKAMAKRYHLPLGALERAGLRTYRYAIATSRYLESELSRANPRLRIAVIPNGTDRGLIARETANTGKEHVLYLGRIAPHQKGIDLLLRAWSGLSGRVGLPLVLAGAGTTREEMQVRQLIARFDLGTSVKMVGRVTGAAKSELFEKALFLALPSRFEASPLVAVEAFCYRLPVVCFGIDELLELPNECTVKVPPFNTPAMAEAMASLVADGDRRLRMGAAAKAHARGFDWDLLAERYEGFLRSLVPRP